MTAFKDLFLDVFAKARSLKNAIGHSGDVLDLEKACRYLGCSLEARDMHPTTYGLLVPSQTGFAVCYLVGKNEREAASDPASDLARFNRFVIAHELGHTHYYTSSKPPRRLRPYGVLGRGSESEEQSCDLFAAALLLPEVLPHQGSDTELGQRFRVPDGIIQWARGGYQAYHKEQRPRS